MNAQHFRAFLWLRWRIRVNQFRRGGTANVVVMIVVAVLGALLAIGSFVMKLLGREKKVDLTKAPDA